MSTTQQLTIVDTYVEPVDYYGTLQGHRVFTLLKDRQGSLYLSAQAYIMGVLRYCLLAYDPTIMLINGLNIRDWAEKLVIRNKGLRDESLVAMKTNVSILHYINCIESINLEIRLEGEHGTISGHVRGYNDRFSSVQASKFNTIYGYNVLTPDNAKMLCRYVYDDCRIGPTTSKKHS